MHRCDGRHAFTRMFTSYRTGLSLASSCMRKSGRRGSQLNCEDDVILLSDTRSNIMNALHIITRTDLPQLVGPGCWQRTVTLSVTLAHALKWSYRHCMATSRALRQDQPLPISPLRAPSRDARRLEEPGSEAELQGSRRRLAGAGAAADAGSAARLSVNAHCVADCTAAALC